MSKAYQIITDRLVEKLAAGTAPWRKPWTGGSRIGENANITTRKPYRGINAFLTAVQGYESPYWMSFKQAKDIGAGVRKGEKGTPIVYFTRLDKERETPTGKEEFQIPLLKYSTVFNVAQLDGLSPKLQALAFPAATVKPFEPIAECARVVSAMPQRPSVEHREQRAWYHPVRDVVNMPKAETFEAPAAYYGTLFHELGHSTGHESRLNRETLRKIAGFGSHEYSKEELVAEMTAAFLCGHTGIDPVTLDNSAAYLASWIKALKGDSKLAIQAAAQAQKAADFILGVKPE